MRQHAKRCGWNKALARVSRQALFAICAGIATLVVFPLGLLAARSSVSQEAAPTAPARRQVMDETGRRLEVPIEANRIVSLAPNLTEIVFALGAGDHLAGDTDFCDYPPEAARKPHVGGPVNPNLEQIVALMPDIVLATAVNRRETVEALARIGLPVFLTDPHSIEEMIASVEHLGSALGVEKAAADLAEDLRKRLSDLDHRLAGLPPRRVLFVVWTDPLISAGTGTFIADAVRHAGGRSVVDTKVEWPRISLEEIVRLQPEFIVFAITHPGDSQSEVNVLRTLPGWRDLEAMRRGNIINLSDAINRPAPRMVDAIQQLARALHPEAFTSGTGAISRPNLQAEEACACAR